MKRADHGGRPLRLYRKPFAPKNLNMLLRDQE
jgi:hypothetical protein